jgi:Raf kinase inhibitor-like YbhB/YbcL family protein
MKLTIPSFENGAPIPAEFAMGIPAADAPATFGPNRSPHITWRDAPPGTQSFALICIDRDAPSVRDDANQPDRTVPHDLPRADFYHWVLTDIPAGVRELPAGCDCEGVTPRGKEVGRTPYGVRGINSYTSWFAGEPSLEGDYGGYDGPFPPWNDERVHHYHFTLYALDVPTLSLSGAFDGADALVAMRGHVLAQDEWVGTYAIYPAARP